MVGRRRGVACRRRGIALPGVSLRGKSLGGISLRRESLGGIALTGIALRGISLRIVRVSPGRLVASGVGVIDASGQEKAACRQRAKAFHALYPRAPDPMPLSRKADGEAGGKLYMPAQASYVTWALTRSVSSVIKTD